MIVYIGIAFALAVLGLIIALLIIQINSPQTPWCICPRDQS